MPATTGQERQKSAWVCVKCGAQNAAQVATCLFCGTDAHTNEAGAPAPVGPSISPSPAFRKSKWFLWFSISLALTIGVWIVWGIYSPDGFFVTALPGIVVGLVILKLQKNSPKSQPVIGRLAFFVMLGGWLALFGAGLLSVRLYHEFLLLPYKQNLSFYGQVAWNAEEQMVKWSGVGGSIKGKAIVIRGPARLSFDSSKGWQEPTLERIYDPTAVSFHDLYFDLPDDVRARNASEVNSIIVVYSEEHSVSTGVTTYQNGREVGRGSESAEDFHGYVVDLSNSKITGTVYGNSRQEAIRELNSLSRRIPAKESK